jgi:hypothetical protein
MAEFDFADVWSCDDGNRYYLALDGIGGIWWVGLSDEAGLQSQGLAFASVFHGILRRDVIDGEWADVPRGVASSAGALSLAILRAADGTPTALYRLDATGSLLSTVWWPTVPRPPFPIAEGPMADVFRRVYKNVQRAGRQGNETLDGNLACLRDSAVVYGTVITHGAEGEILITSTSPPNGERTYAAFMDLGTWSGTGDQPDCDIGFYLQVDTNKFTPDFWATGWTAPSHAAEVQQLMNRPLEAEVIMFGRDVPAQDWRYFNPNVPPLLPGWQEVAGDSVLLNGRPIEGQLDLQPSSVAFFLGPTPELCSRVRVAGVMVYDHGHWHGNPRKLEIHPVFSIDVLTGTAKSDLSGVWGADNGDTYYVHRVGDHIWWLGLGPYRDRRTAAVFHGTLKASTFTGRWVQTPFGYGGGTGEASFTVDPGLLTIVPDPALLQITGNWTKLYDGWTPEKPGLPNVGEVIAMAAFYSGDDKYWHLLVGTSDSSVTELWYNPAIGLGQTALDIFPDLLDLAAFFARDDDFRIVVTASHAGDVTEIFYNPDLGKGEDFLERVQSVAMLGAFYTADDSYRCVITATKGGEMRELGYHPDLGRRQRPLGTYPGLVNLAAFYAEDDHSRIVIMVTAAGDVVELAYDAALAKGVTLLDRFPGIAAVTAFYSGDTYRRVVVLTTDGTLTEIAYNPNLPRSKTVRGYFPTAVKIAGFYSPLDRFCHVVVALKGGQLEELLYR